MHVVSRNSEYNYKLDPLQVNETLFREYLMEKQKCKNAEFTRNLHNNSMKNYILNENLLEVEDKNVGKMSKILLMLIKWIQSLPSFKQLKTQEQEILSRNNWKEVFVLTASQCFSNTGDGKYIFFFIKTFVKPLPFSP